MKIIENKAKCKLCGDVVVSKDESLYVHCSCGALGVSGGSSSIMRLGHHNHFKELSVKDYS